MGEIRRKLIFHKDLEEVKRAERLTTEKWKKERLLSIRLLSDSKMSYLRVSEIVGRSAKQIKVWSKIFIEGGIDSLLTRGNGGGRKGNMTPEAQEALIEKLRAGEFRTAKQFCKWLKEEFGIHLAQSSMYYQLGKLGGRLKVARPCHTKKSPEKAEAFKAQLADKLVELNLPKEKEVSLWVYDEMRYGLHPLMRKMWSLIGHRVIAPVNRRFQWGYLFGAIEVSEEKAGSEFLYTQNVLKDFDYEFMKQIAQSDVNKIHVVIGDGAGFHHKEGQEHENPLPDNIRILTLPPYSPELNPMEKYWDIIKDVTCTKYWDTLEALEVKIDEVLQEWWSRPEGFSSLFTNSYLRDELNVTTL